MSTDSTNSFRLITRHIVHGTGSASRLEWSWKKGLSLFWPEKRLPLDPGVDQVRILMPGYNANFMSLSTGLFDIAESASEMMLRMKLGMTGTSRSRTRARRPLSSWSTPWVAWL